MVLLTITPAIATAIAQCQEVAPDKLQALYSAKPMKNEESPSLNPATPGSPISHAQLIALVDIHNASTKHDAQRRPIRLNDLLRGSSVYIPPAPPKPKKSPSYEALMSRLRKEEEAKSYARLLGEAAPDVNAKDSDPDEMTYADVNRQLALIINVLVSIVACSVAVWIAARYWNTPARLALSMTAGGTVGAAEVVIYTGYISRLVDARTKERKKAEKKVVTDTWIIGRKGGESIAKDRLVKGEENVVKRKGKS